MLPKSQTMGTNTHKNIKQTDGLLVRKIKLASKAQNG